MSETVSDIVIDDAKIEDLKAALEKWVSNNKRELEPQEWEKDPTLRECLHCGALKHGVTTREINRERMYSCDDCHKEALEYYSEEEQI